jgi:flagellar assembly protein FliH
MGVKNLIRSDKAKKLPLAEFQKFERRPVNYYRDVFAEEETNGSGKLNEQEFNARVEELLAAERHRIGQQHENDLHSRFEEGLKQGRQEGAGDVKRAIEMLHGYANMLQAEKKELAEKAEQSALELAFQLAHKIVTDELRTRPEAVAEIAKNALRQVLDCDQIRLRVNQDDYDYLRSVQSELEGMLSKSVPLEVRVDNSVERGGCMIETERGNLDARIASQLQTLRTGLKDGASSARS